MRSLLVMASFASAGCLRSTSFHCDTDSDCGSGGQCEISLGGFCSFADSSCTVSGRKFGDNSGPNSNQCVGETTGGENPGGEPSMGSEPLPMGCLGTFNTLPNSGPRGHKYLLLNTNASWTTHRNTCATMMSWMAFPDGANLADAQMELAAITTLAGAGAWVGINDLPPAQEGQYRNSLNNPVSAITNMLINAGGGNPNGQDCLVSATTDMTDEDCNGSRKAVCECVP